MVMSVLCESRTESPRLRRDRTSSLKSSSRQKIELSWRCQKDRAT